MFHMFYFESNLVDSKSLSYKIHFAILLHISHRNVKYIFRIWIRISIYWFRMGVQVQLITFVHILRTFCIKWIDCFLIQFVSLPCFSILRWMLVWPNRHGVINFQIIRLITNKSLGFPNLHIQKPAMHITCQGKTKYMIRTNARSQPHNESNYPNLLQNYWNL